MLSRFLCALVLLLVASPVHAETLGWWRLEQRDAATLKSEADGPAASTKTLGMAALADVTPGPFVYDPRSGESRANRSSLRVRSVEGMPTTSNVWQTPNLPAIEQGFTLEAFVLADVQPTLDGAVVLRLSGREGVVEIGATRADVYQWWSGRIKIGDRPPQVIMQPRYMGLPHIRPKIWRHLALVHDPQTRVVRLFIDYTPQGEATIDGPLTFASPTLEIAGQDGGRGLNGWIDEVRVTAQPLPPWEFLRASPQELKNVSFRPSASDRWLADMGFVDLKLRYGAVGDGVTDDTHAFRRAFAELADRVPIAYDTLWIPPGTYLVSDTVAWSRFLIVQGAGRDKTTLRLKDRSPGFGDEATPKPVVVASNGRRGGPGGSGSSIGNYLFDLTIDTGAGNFGAIALEFHSNNHGSAENLTLRSGDGRGATGLDCTRAWCGPTLFKNIAIEGFDVGVNVGQREYSLVFSGLTLKNQNVVGIRNVNNLLAIEKLTSVNRVPAIVSQGGSLLVLLDSDLKGGDSPQAIDNTGVLYLRNVRADGYETVVAGVAERRIAEHHSHKAVSGHESPSRPLNLPVERTPTPPIEPPTEWVNVLTYKTLVKEGDWTAAIQAAFDSGKATIYFPTGHGYTVRDTVRVPATVRRLVGALTAIAGDHQALGDKPVVRIEGETDAPLVIERLGVRRHGADRAGLGLVHASRRPLVAEHAELHEYGTEAGVGPAFFEDVMAVFRFRHPQKIWARHINPETRDIPEIVNDGADLWILGLKTEYTSTNIVNRKGAKTEVLGGLIYPVEPVPADLPMFVNEEASLSILCGISAYPHNHRIYVRDTRDGRQVDVEAKTFPAIAGRPMIPLYTSYRK